MLLEFSCNVSNNDCIYVSDDKINYRTDDEYLLRFLRVRKFNADKAFKTIQDFYSVRRKHSDVFDLPPNLESLLNMNFFVRLPYVDEDGRILFTVDYGTIISHFQKLHQGKYNIYICIWSPMKNLCFLFKISCYKKILGKL